MRPVTALLDANVLFSAQLRNLLLQLAMNDIFVAKWSAQIEDEWLRNLPEQTRDRVISRTIPLVRSWFSDAHVADFDAARIIGTTDAKDRHVASAAAAIAPSVLVTLNLKDFDFAALEAIGVAVKSPDDFLVERFDHGPAIVEAATKEAAANLSRSFPAWDEYLSDLSTRHGLQRFVERMRSWKPEDTDDSSDAFPIPTVK